MADIKQAGNDMVRVNARIGKQINKWLDDESAVTGVPKSTLIHLALDQYISQRKVIASMESLTPLLQNMESKFEHLEAKIDNLSSGSGTE